MSGKFIDFQELKRNVKIEDVLSHIGLALKQHGEQLRGACPVCKSGGDRALVVTPAKQAFYCFPAKTGGDIIALVSHIMGNSAKEAAQLIAEKFLAIKAAPSSARKGTVPSTVPEKEKAGINPLTYLLAEHETVRCLGIEIEIAKDWGIGYAPKGTMRGRVLFPIRNREGILVAYCGLGENPRWLFPSNFDPATEIFGADRVESGELRIATDPIDAVIGQQNGVQMVAFLTDCVSRIQLERLVSI